jgi:acylphosphatase
MAEKPSQDKTGFHARIHGRVQGVGFRYTTRNEAKRRRLSGWVRNDPDGSVEVVCEGDADKVASFEKWLHKGPPGAYVTDVEIKKVPYKGTYNDFTSEL